MSATTPNDLARQHGDLIMAQLADLRALSSSRPRVARGASGCVIEPAPPECLGHSVDRLWSPVLSPSCSPETPGISGMPRWCERSGQLVKGFPYILPLSVVGGLFVLSALRRKRRCSSPEVTRG